MSMISQSQGSSSKHYFIIFLIQSPSATVVPNMQGPINTPKSAPTLPGVDFHVLSVPDALRKGLHRMSFMLPCHELPQWPYSSTPSWHLMLLHTASKGCFPVPHYFSDFLPFCHILTIKHSHSIVCFKKTRHNNPKVL